MKFFSVWMWESLENLPMILGFVIATRLWKYGLFNGLVVLVVGMALGVFVTRLVEPKLHKVNHQVRWKNMLINFLLFVVLAIPFVHYFRTDTDWFNWKTDLLGGLAAGLILTLVQSAHWKGAKSRMFLHSAAMMVAFPIIMLGLRSIIRMGDWGLSISLTFLLTLAASLIITLIDYREMYLQE